MKTKLLCLLALLLCNNIIAQTKPDIPTIEFLTSTKVFGSGKAAAILHIKPATNTAVINNTIPSTGIIDFTLADINAGEDVVIWITLSGVDSDKIVKTVQTDAQVITAITSQKQKQTYTSYTSGLIKQLDEIENDKMLLKGRIIEQRKWIWNTNFNIPIARFNFIDNAENKSGDIVLFNSIGAGFGLSHGEFRTIYDQNGEIADEKFKNAVGLHLGILFSANTSEDVTNVFAPTLTFTALDFGIGVGCELGTRQVNQDPIFVTISYAIPLYKLADTGYWITNIFEKKEKPENTAANAQQVAPVENTEEDNYNYNLINPTKSGRAGKN